jgi:hypothetical protein
MRLLFNLMSLLISFELLVAPLCQSLGMHHQNAYGAGCPTGQTFNSELNRCLTSDETAQVMQATASCNGDRDCYMRNAQEALQKVNAPGHKEMSGFGNNTMKGLATAIPVAMAFSLSRLKGNKCAQVSYWLFVGAGVAMIIGDVFINISHHKRLKKIKEDWGKIVSPSGDLDQQREMSINAQSEAFGKLAESERSLEKAANSKKTIYYIAAIAYGAAAITAGLELLNPMALSPCSAKVDPPKPEPKPEIIPKSIYDRIDIPHDINIDINTVPPFPTKSITFNQSLYRAYTEESERPQFYDEQFYRNISSSTNFTSLVMNQKAFEKRYSSPSIDEYELLDKSFNEIKEATSSSPEAFELFKMISINVMKELNPLPNAIAEDQTNASKSFENDGKKFDHWSWITPLMGGAVGAALAKWQPKVSEWMVSSVGRTVLGSVMSGLTFWLASHAGSVAENAGKRAETLDKMKADFLGASSTLYACKSEDRDNPGKPNCYCYTPENQKNPNRGNSQVCQKLWAGANVKFKSVASSENRKYCIDKNYKADGLCACKKTGSCLKASAGKISGVSASTLTMLNSSLDPLNALNNGNSSMADLEKTNLQANALRMIEANKKLLESPALSKFKDKIKNGEAQLNQQLQQISTKASGGDLLSSSSSSIPKNAGEAARMLEQELKPNSPQAIDGNQGVIAAPGNKPEENTPEFGLSMNQLDEQKTQVSEVMKDEFDYRGNEINDSSKTNIFEVLSNRYQKSGMKKLFDDNEKK